MNLTQKIIEIATITLKNSDLGNINEGETRNTTKEEVPKLGDAIMVTVSDSVSQVNLNLDSNLDDLSGFYSTYDIVVRFSQVAGSTYSVGETACILSIGSEDYSSIKLDNSGEWRFDLEVTSTAKSIDYNTPTTAIIIVTALEA
jgi:hypothetical protein